MGLINPKIGDEKIGNFDITVHRMVDVYTDSSAEAERHVELSLVLESGNSGGKQRVALSELSSEDWNKSNPHAIFDPKFPVTKANRYITNAIQQELDGLPVEKIYLLSHPGVYKINGEAVFCTGVEVIRPPAGTTPVSKIELGPMSLHLNFDSDVSEEEAAAETLNLIALFPNPGRIILSQVLVFLMRQIYEDAGVRPSFGVFLYGRTGTQKTTLASFLIQIYNRSEGIVEPTRLNTSLASAVEMLMDTVDQVKIFDDLFPSDSGQVRKKQEETLSEITRYIGDGTIPTRMRGGMVREGHPKCGVLFTGEYLIGEGSDAARLLPVKMTKPDTTALRRFQERPLILSTFYRNFILWFIENYDGVVAYLKEWLDEYRKTDLGVHDRLRETHFFLNTAYSLLLEYCGEKSVLEEADVRRFHSSFAGLLTQLVCEQNKRVSPTTSHPTAQGHVLERIRELYRGGEFSIPEDKKQFDYQYHYGVIHKECLCLWHKALPHFFPSSKIEDIVCELDEQGALVKGNDGSPKRKISDAHGNFFYCIPLSCLS